MERRWKEECRGVDQNYIIFTFLLPNVWQSIVLYRVDYPFIPHGLSILFVRAIAVHFPMAYNPLLHTFFTLSLRKNISHQKNADPSSIPGSRHIHERHLTLDLVQWWQFYKNKQGLRIVLTGLPIKITSLQLRLI